MVSLEVVEQYLEDYPNLRAKLTSLLFDIQYFFGISAEELIEALTYAHIDRDRVQVCATATEAVLERRQLAVTLQAVP